MQGLVRYIDHLVANQSDLVEALQTLDQVVCVKG